MAANVRQQFKVAKEHIQRRDIEAARSKLLEIELGSSYMMFHRMLAGCAFLEKDYELASSHIEKAISLSPDKQVLIADAIRIYKARGDKARMRELCASFNIAKSESGSELYRVAMAIKLLGDFDGAVEALEKALRLSPENVIIRVNYGMILALKDRISEAMQQWTFCLKYNPKAVLALACMGRLHMHQKEYVKAIDFFKLAVESSEDSKEPRNLDLAEAYVRASSSNEARDLLTTISTENSPRLHYVWGLLHYSAADYLLSHSSFARCISIGKSKEVPQFASIVWQEDVNTDSEAQQVLETVKPTLDALFDPINILKFSEHDFGSTLVSQDLGYDLV